MRDRCVVCLAMKDYEYRIIVSEGSLTTAAKPILSHHSLGSLHVYSRGLVESNPTTYSKVVSQLMTVDITCLRDR